MPGQLRSQIHAKPTPGPHQQELAHSTPDNANAHRPNRRDPTIAGDRPDEKLIPKSDADRKQVDSIGRLIKKLMPYLWLILMQNINKSLHRYKMRIQYHKKAMNRNKSNTLAVVAFAFVSSAISQVSAANITLGPGTTTVTTSANQFMGIGTGNIFDGTYPQFAVGESSEFDAESSGIAAGWSNILGYGSYASILVGQSNFADAPFSAIFGESNSIVQDPLVGWNPSNLISGSYNEMEGFMTSTILGSDNDLVFVTRPGGGNVGVSSLVVGQSNQFEGGVGWIIGYLNEASGDASSTFGWGLLNPGFAATVVGTFNEEIESSPSSHEEDGAAFVVGNGTYNSRSNAIETLKNGETTLINKAWNSADPLGVPVATDSADGNALVVDGHTVLNGKVIISEPQGDISMGIYE